MTNGFQVVVEFLHHRHAGRNVEVNNLFIWNVFKILHKCPQAVAVGRNQNPLPRPYAGSDDLVPAGQKAVHSVLEAFGEWKLLL